MKNQGNQVAKASPEEQAIIQNIGSLLQELQGIEASEVNEPTAPQGGAPAAQMAMKAEEERTPAAAANVSNPEAGPKDQGMANWNDDEVKKAFKLIAKSIQASESDGPTANEDGQERVEDLPEPDEENIKEVAKALLKAGLIKPKKTVTKSSNSGEMAQIMSVVKAMGDRINQQGQVIAELLEGIGLVPEAPQTVQKSQDQRPAASAGVFGTELTDVIAAVVKGLQTGGYQQSGSGVPVAKGFGGPAVNREDMQEFTEAFGQMSGWARPVQD